MALTGFIDSSDGWFAHGWAFDSENPDRPVAVDLRLSSGWRINVQADIHRPDLAAQGLGNGNHGFRVRLPIEAGQTGEVTLSASIPGTGFVLHHSPLPIPPALPVEIVAGDIVNNCNLRCPFCITDYERIKGLRLMTRETLEHSVPLMPAVADGGFWLSCMHEPTLHPKFADLVEIVPGDLRQKVSFTTNLCKRVAPDTLKRIAQSGIHSVRVSFDSLEPGCFERLRKGGRFATFMEQLRLFTQYLRESPAPPRLDFVTVVLRDNLEEVPDLVRAGRTEFGVQRHEVRFMYYAPHLAEWGASHILSLDQWHTLRARILEENSGFDIAFGDPPENVEQQFESREGVSEYEHPEAVFGGPDTVGTYTPADPLTSGFPVPDANFRLRLRWDGLMMAEELPEWEMRTNINDLPDPAGYFTRLRAAARRAGADGPGLWSRV